jgi:hypothetical protein
MNDLREKVDRNHRIEDIQEASQERISNMKITKKNIIEKESPKEQLIK